MKKAQVLKFPPGSPEYVVLHARWQRSRGRAPSEVLQLGKNPRKSLALAEEEAYFPITGVYLDGRVPPSYKCEVCAATGCKLWRRWQSPPPHLRCASCLTENEKKARVDAEEQVQALRHTNPDLYTPALLKEAGAAYWYTSQGWYNSAPGPAWDWWRKLPQSPVLVTSPSLAA